MKLAIILFLLFADPGSNLHKVARANKAKSSAEKAYKTGNYQQALKNYQYLTDSLKVTDEEVMLDKAHCYYKLKDKDNAQKVYSKLASATDKSISTIANQQLGLLAYGEKDLGKAVNYFKAALKAYPNNQEARYNYELVKKLMKKEDENNKNNQKKDKNDSKDPIEPSEFAKKLKLQAEALARSYRYEEAHMLMTNGIKKDKSVLSFKDFIERLKVVADLNKL